MTTHNIHTDTFNLMIQRVRSWNIEKGWRGTGASPITIGDEVALIHTEVSEMFEAYRTYHDLENHTDEKGKPEGFPSEVADVLIRLLDVCGEYDIDLYQEFVNKMDYNDTRAFQHGGKAL